LFFCPVPLQYLFEKFNRVLSKTFALISALLCSDSIIRIFTRDSSRVASVDGLKALEAELASMEHSTKEVLEGVKTEDLPTDSALFAPGEKDGQTKIIRSHDGRVEVYNWSASESIWQKIGDVVGSSGGNEKSSGRTLHQGKVRLLSREDSILAPCVRIMIFVSPFAF
jgi:PFU (PLAA family ubiquitin binding)